MNITQRLIRTEIQNGFYNKRFIYRQEIMDRLNQAITDCEEGIVVKDPYSVYKPNSRKAGWYKIKPEVR